MDQHEFLGETATISHPFPLPQNDLFTIATRRYCFFINPAVLAQLEKEFGKLCVVTVPSGDSCSQVGEALSSVFLLLRIT